MIKELLNSEMIEINDSEVDWKEAIRIAGNLLLKKDFIEKSYIDGMIEMVEEYGPYIVLIKNIALAHTRPDKGAKKIGLSLVKFKKPVTFHNEINDPVKILFALSAVDHNSHMELISEMGNLFCDENMIDEFVNADTKEEFLDIISRIAVEN
ncbi:MAG: PTS sugar transporter subunit IIA [Erysipelotrichaceae bacterium]|nr:PTS sugar transporter subunit IIA [Erysipelotrichaceae bacterium]